MVMPSNRSGRLDVKAILRALVAEDVEFLVIGDLAVAAHGYPRATVDLDIIPRPEPTNLERLHGALAATAAMKQAASRRQDDEDLARLREARAEG